MASSLLSSLSFSPSGPRICSATNYSSNSLFFNCKAPGSPILYFPHILSWPVRGISFSSSPLQTNGRRLVSKRCYAAPNSAKSASEEKDDLLDVLQESENDVDLESLPSVENLLKVYKESMLSGDEESAAEIETTLHMIETQKNEFVQKALNLSAEISAQRDKCVRLQADFDNFRKRFENDKLSIMSLRKGDIVERLLVLIDSFDRARLLVKPETEKEKRIETSYQGIYKQFVEIMKNLQVAAIPTVGKPFNPSLHESIAREESKEFKEGIVMQEIRRGFLFGDRVLRPATVKVSSGPGEKEVGPIT